MDITSPTKTPAQILRVGLPYIDPAKKTKMPQWIFSVLYGHGPGDITMACFERFPLESFDEAERERQAWLTQNAGRMHADAVVEMLPERAAPITLKRRHLQVVR